jgi:hypothetical protein
MVRPIRTNRLLETRRVVRMRASISIFLTPLMASEDE